MDVNYFTDRKGNKVKTGDTIGYFRGITNEFIFDAVIRRITKSGSYIEVFVHGREYPLSTLCIELLPKANNSTESA